MKTVLIFGHVFPEPNTTAAGTRMMQLIELFQNQSMNVVFATAAPRNSFSYALEEKQVSTEAIRINDPAVDTLLTRLMPDIVVFDRFYTEEQYGWRVAEHCPNALRILDTEDLHFLRNARENAVRNGKTAEDAHLYTDDAKRELASILRCDLSLIISEVEYQLLIQQFSIPEGLLCYLPFLIPASESSKETKSFAERKHFISVGNFKHAPNVDAFRLLRDRIWPEIRKKLPQAELHLYGAHSEKVADVRTRESAGFYVNGWVEDLKSAIAQSRVMLVPLRFGAGLKGKIIESWIAGTPVLSTAIGIEGLDNDDYGVLPTDDAAAWGVAAKQLYSDRNHWTAQQSRGTRLLQQRFDKASWESIFRERLRALHEHREAHRKKHFISQILQHHTLQSYRYLSKYIMLKNQSKNT